MKIKAMPVLLGNTQKTIITHRPAAHSGALTGFGKGVPHPHGFLAKISLMIQIQLIKSVQKKQGLILDEFSHVNGSLLLFVHEGPGAKVLTVRSDGFRFLAHSLTPFGHESAASGGRG